MNHRRLMISVAVFLFASILAGCLRTARVAPAPETPPVSVNPAPNAGSEAVVLQFRKGVHLLEKGETKEARFVFEKLRDDHPQISMYYVNLGVTYKRLGLLPEAIASYQHALEIDRDDAGIYYNMGIALRESGEFRKAEQAYKTALVILPDFMDAHYNLAVLYDLYLDEPDRAVEHYRRYLDLGGGNPDEVQIWITALEKRKKSEALP
jgi:tetratricopeptide (TPR) repeat protein